MANTYPVRFPAQLRQHLRALRKKHGLTQANVAALIGVSQARIAEIEANPGLVSFEQLMQLLAALRTTVTLCDIVPSPSPDQTKGDPRSETSITRQVGDLDHARKALEVGSGSDSEHNAIEALGSPDQARKALESLGGPDQARKALVASSGLDAARKAIDSLGGLEQAREVLEAASASEALRKTLGDLDSLHSYRNALDHSKKGNW